MRVLCAGHVNWDVALHVDRLPGPDGEVSVRRRVQSGGGSAANVAAGLAGLGTDASLFGSVGTDGPGRLAVGDLEATGVDCANVREVDGETVVKYLVVDERGEVMVLANPGVNEAFAADDLASGTLSRIDHLHLTSQRPGTAAALAERAARRDATVSFDPGRRVADRDYGGVIRRADVVFLNEREADAVGDVDSLRRGAAVVVKRGGGGARVLSSDGEFAHPGFDVDAVDTTGAGDAFAAGFIAARADGYERALAVANACGAIAARTPGARADLSWTAVESMVDG